MNTINTFFSSNKNNNDAALENPFAGKPKVMRSPVLSQSQITCETPPSEKSVLPTEESLSGSTDFEKLGAYLNFLVDILEGGRRSYVNQNMIVAIKKARALHKHIGRQSIPETSQKTIPDTTDKLVQTDPIISESGEQCEDVHKTPVPAVRTSPSNTGDLEKTTPTTEPRKRKNRDDADLPRPKKPIRRTPVREPTISMDIDEAESQMVHTVTYSDAVRTEDSETNTTETDKQTTEKRDTTDRTGWTKVEKKKKPAKRTKQKTQVRKTRPDAIVVKQTGNLSYAEILRKVKADPKLEELGNEVSKIRRTQKGELLIQLKQSGPKSREFSSKIGSVLGADANVKTLNTRVKVECKDLDEITTKEELSAAIKTQYGEEISVDDIVLRRTYGETQSAVLSVSEDTAKKLLDGRKLKVGWSVCGLREKVSLTKCFRCLEFGHIARNCKNEDRSKLCRKCGKEGHIAKSCNNDPCCMFCIGSTPEKAKHIACTNRCPFYRRALKTCSR